MTTGASEGDRHQSGVELLGWKGVGRGCAGGLGAVKSPLDDNGLGRGRPGVGSLRRGVNDSRDGRRCRTARGRENTRRLVVCAVTRRVAVARGCRLDSRRQRPGAMAHLHRGGAICSRARHEAWRHQHASRQGWQEQQPHQQASLPPLEPGCLHQGSLMEKRRGARLRDFPYRRSPIRWQWPDRIYSASVAQALAQATHASRQARHSSWCIACGSQASAQAVQNRAHVAASERTSSGAALA